MGTHPGQERPDRNILMEAILRLKKMDREDLAAKMNWWVDANGKRVERSHEGAIRYTDFALRNREVREAYNLLKAGKGPTLDQL
jgi:hypothetical protein